jgi:hypothetical protein
LVIILLHVGQVAHPIISFPNASVSQGGRWFSYRVKGDWPLPMEEINPHRANMHMLPADGRIERQLKSIHS